jgi:hypothetical protein
MDFPTTKRTAWAHEEEEEVVEEVEEVEEEEEEEFHLIHGFIKKQMPN